MPIAASTGSRQRGFSLIESLVALLVTALGLLGIVGLQLRALADTQAAVRRAQALRLIEDLGERMRTNPNALLNIGQYLSGYGQKGGDINATDCAAIACNPVQLARYDLQQWKTTVQHSLPAGQASVFLAPGEAAGGNRRQLGVMIAWRENERHIADPHDRQAYRDHIDASQLRQPDGSFTPGAGGANACPAGFSCHLQYLAVSARCAPYASGGTSQVYCP